MRKREEIVERINLIEEAYARYENKYGDDEEAMNNYACMCMIDTLDALYWTIGEDNKNVIDNGGVLRILGKDECKRYSF